MISNLLPAVGFCTTPLPNGGGYTYTLTTLLGEFLHTLETAYGPRDHTYTPLGIEFFGNRPHLWYPGNRKYVSIILSDVARNNVPEAIFQLAHEAVHLLSPTGDSSSLVIEEGFANGFSINVSAKSGHGIVGGYQPYAYATDLLIRLLNIYPRALQDLRKIEPQMHRWDAKIINQTCPNAPQSLVDRLSERFDDVERAYNATGALPYP